MRIILYVKITTTERKVEMNTGTRLRYAMTLYIWYQRGTNPTREEAHQSILFARRLPSLPQEHSS